MREEKLILQIDPLTVFDAILTSRHTCEKLQCLYENLMSINFRKNCDKVYYSKLSHMLPHVIPGVVLRISSDGDDRRIFGGFEIFDSGKFGKYFFGCLVYMLVGTFLGIQNKLKILGCAGVSCCKHKHSIPNLFFVLYHLLLSGKINVKDFQARKFGMGFF